MVWVVNASKVNFVAESGRSLSYFVRWGVLLPDLSRYGWIPAIVVRELHIRRPAVARGFGRLYILSAPAFMDVVLAVAPLQLLRRLLASIFAADALFDVPNQCATFSFAQAGQQAQNVIDASY